MITIKSNKFEIKSITGIIFDKDGTITNSNTYWSEIIKMRADEICRRYKINKIFYPYVCKSMGLDINTNLLLPDGPIALKSRGEVIINLINNLEELNINTSEKEVEDIFREVHEIFSLKVNSFIMPIDSAIKLIKKLSQHKVKLSLITSDSTKNANLALKKLNLDYYFDCVIGGDADLDKKSTGRPAKYVCEKLNLQREQVIAIGDASMDLEMSVSAGLLDCILVASGQTPLEKLELMTSNCISSLDQLEII